MERTPSPQYTEEQLRRQAAAEQQLNDVINGVITEPKQLDPKATSPEAVQEARRKLGELGLLGATFTQSRL